MVLAAFQLAELPVGLFFSFWLIATVLRALRRDSAVFRRLGVFGQLVPLWNFFAPTPNTFDQFVLYRDELIDERVTAWREAEIPAHARSLVAPIWNVGKFEAKALIDVVQALMGEVARAKGPHRDLMIRISMAYLLLLNRVGTRGHHPMARRTQFLIVQRDRQRGTLTPTFISARHALEGVSPKDHAP